VQNDIRAAIASHKLVKVFVPVLNNVRKGYAFGGTSGSGKSTMAEAIVQHHKAKYQRITIDYLLEQASQKKGKDVSLLTVRQQTTTLLGELNAYASAHDWLEHIAIEDTHDFGLLASLKHLLGDRLKIIYVDAPLGTRQARSSDAASVVGRDAANAQRGADRVESIADIIVKNEARQTSAAQRLMRSLGGR